MKKKIFLLGLGMCALQAFAQQGFYVAPSVGVGMSNASHDFYKMVSGGGQIKPSAVLNYNAQLSVGYGFGRWRVESGIQYATTGFIYKGLIMDTPPGDIISGTEETRYYHLSVPLRVGYTLPLGSRRSLSPMAGALVSFNTGARTIVDFPVFRESDTKWTSDNFKTQKQGTSVWGNVSLQAGFRLNGRVTVFAGPGLQYMLTNFLKAPAASPYKASERPYFINMDIGARINL